MVPSRNTTKITQEKDGKIIPPPDPFPVLLRDWKQHLNMWGDPLAPAGAGMRKEMQRTSSRAGKMQEQSRP